MPASFFVLLTGLSRLNFSNVVPVAVCHKSNLGSRSTSPATLDDTLNVLPFPFILRGRGDHASVRLL
jgi:hypothetical protein